jgi:hypothetical protein
MKGTAMMPVAVCTRVALLVLAAALLMAVVTEGKGGSASTKKGRARQKKKRQRSSGGGGRGSPEVDLLCSACEVAVSDVEERLRSAAAAAAATHRGHLARDEAAVMDALDGVCGRMEYFAFSQDFPRRFVKATGHGGADPDTDQDSHGALAKGVAQGGGEAAAAGTSSKGSGGGDGAGGGVVRVLKAKVMHDRAADRKLQALCERHMDALEDQLISALRLSKGHLSRSSSCPPARQPVCSACVHSLTLTHEAGRASISARSEKPLATEFCYQHVSECKQRDTLGGKLVCPVLSSRQEIQGFLDSVRRHKGTGVVAFTADDDDDGDGEGDGPVRATVAVISPLSYAVIAD